MNWIVIAADGMGNSVARDSLTSLAAISDFAKKHNAGLTVMEGGEHWFHTEEQMRFLDKWIRHHESMSGCETGKELCEVLVWLSEDDFPGKSYLRCSPYTS